MNGKATTRSKTKREETGILAHFTLRNKHYRSLLKGT